MANEPKLSGIGLDSIVLTLPKLSGIGLDSIVLPVPKLSAIGLDSSNAKTFSGGIDINLSYPILFDVVVVPKLTNSLKPQYVAGIPFIQLGKSNGITPDRTNEKVSIWIGG